MKRKSSNQENAKKQILTSIEEFNRLYFPQVTDNLDKFFSDPFALGVESAQNSLAMIGQSVSRKLRATNK